MFACTTLACLLLLFSLQTTIAEKKATVCRTYSYESDDDLPKCERQTTLLQSKEQTTCDPKHDENCKERQDKVNEQEERISRLEEALEISRRRDCRDVAKDGFSVNGVYNISVNGFTTEVYCDLENDGGGWLVFQKRFSGEVNFDLEWNDYQVGFGEKDGEFWLGLDTLHAITKHRTYTLRINLEDWENNTAYAEYNFFKVNGECCSYVWRLGSYSGTAGDALVEPQNSIHRLNNRPFSTKDRDNDGNGVSNCAITYSGGGWWYNDCYAANLNAPYVEGGNKVGDDGIVWKNWKGLQVSMKKTEMKIRPV